MHCTQDDSEREQYYCFNMEVAQYNMCVNFWQCHQEHQEAPKGFFFSAANICLYCDDIKLPLGELVGHLGLGSEKDSGFRKAFKNRSTNLSEEEEEDDEEQEQEQEK